MAYFVIALVLFALPVEAYDYSTKRETKHQFEHKAKPSSNGCDALMQHVPDSDVTHQPQDDDWADVPVNTTPSTLTAEDFQHIDIPLNLPLGAYMGGRRPGVAGSEKEAFDTGKNVDSGEGKHGVDLSESWIRPGFLSVDTKTGTTLFNGKDITTLDPVQLDPDCWQEKNPPE